MRAVIGLRPNVIIIDNNISGTFQMLLNFQGGSIKISKEYVCLQIRGLPASCIRLIG